MFGIDFYPTPGEVIDKMIAGLDLSGKIILEPSAGSGAIVDRVKDGGAEVLACEIDADLRKILQTKCKVIESDFLKLDSVRISHVDFIIMNPPFSADEKHILHAYEIAPAGCEIIALCNSSTLSNLYTAQRKELSKLIDEHGTHEKLGECFTTAQRKTYVNVSLVRISKPGANYSQEFEGFFMEEEVEEVTGPGLMSYDFIRDLVNRYVESIKIFDQQLETAARLNDMARGFFDSNKQDLSISVTRGQVPVMRNDFKKSMQKDGWNFVFSKLNMDKYTTKGLREDINKFVETQSNVPFTMRNIYKMLEIVVGTTSARMDKAIIEVFDQVTSHHADNRFNIEGWKTNSHYLLTRRFILPRLTEVGWSGKISPSRYENFERVEDLIKALCYVTGDNYGDMVNLERFLRYRYFLVRDGKFLSEDHYGPICAHDEDKLRGFIERYPGSEIIESVQQWGKWFDWSYFRIRVYKKGTIHFEFKDEEVWALFNQRVAKIKGYPLAERKEQTSYQKKQSYSGPVQGMAYKDRGTKVKPVILDTINI